jgi:hypothetical protein
VYVSNDGVNWQLVWWPRWHFEQQEWFDYGWGLATHELGPTADNQPTVYLRWSLRLGYIGDTIRTGGWNIDDVSFTRLDCSRVCNHFGFPGDMDCDNDCDFDDITLFVTAIGDTGPAWAAKFQALFGAPPTCSMLNGDFDYDGDIDFDDITPFVNAIGTAPPPTTDAFIPIDDDIAFTTDQQGGATSYAHVQVLDDYVLDILYSVTSAGGPDTAANSTIQQGSTITIPVTAAIPYGTPVTLHVDGTTYFTDAVSSSTFFRLLEDGVPVVVLNANDSVNVNITTHAGATFTVRGAATISGYLSGDAEVHVTMQASAELPDASFDVLQAPPAVYCGPDPMLVQVQITAPAGATINPGACLLHYQAGGVWIWKPMSDLGGGVFEATLLPPGLNDFVAYYVEAWDTDGTYYHYPLVGPLDPRIVRCEE